MRSPRTRLLGVLSHPNRVRGVSVTESSTARPDTAEASFTIDGTPHELPVLKGTLGPDVIDIGALYQNTGHFTYDLGLSSCGSPMRSARPRPLGNRSMRHQRR